MFSARRISLKSISGFNPKFASTLAFVESSNNKITPASLSALNAAKKLNQPITAILVGKTSAKIVKDELPKYSANIEKVLIAPDSKYNHYLPEEVSPLLQSILSDSSNDFTHCIVPSSFTGKSLLPRVAAKLNVQPISDIIAVEGPSTFQRFIYAGNAIATIKSSDSLVLASVRASSFEPLEAGAPKELAVQELAYVEPEAKEEAEWVGENIMKSERPDLGSAKYVVSGGRGLGSKENFDKLIDPLAKSLNAAVCASRGAVDGGFVDNSLQVGQTGKIIAPDLYIAVGISGAIQQLAGMRDSKAVGANNKAEEALE